MSDPRIQQLIEDASFEFSMGETENAVAKLQEAITCAPDNCDAWHALAEIQFHARQLDQALEAAERAHELQPDSIFVNTSLSRIWMERGDKERAEHFGARARVLGWKDQLKTDPPPPPGPG